MFEDRLAERLREDLERPRLASQHPAGARYRLAVRGPGRQVVGVLRVGGAFLAGAVVAAAALSAETGSTNPRVWTVRVASALTQLTEPEAPPTPSPRSPAPSGSGGAGAGPSVAIPAIRPSGHDDGSSAGSSDDHGASVPSSGDDGMSTPGPTESPDDHGSSGSDGTTAGPDEHGSPGPSPTPAASDEPER